MLEKSHRHLIAWAILFSMNLIIWAAGTQGGVPPPALFSLEPAVNSLPQLSSITRYGITWTFSQPVPVGQFVNGDYSVVGPVTIIHLNPLPTPANGPLFSRD